jgi:hypothetical protein
MNWVHSAAPTIPLGKQRDTKSVKESRQSASGQVGASRFLSAMNHLLAEFIRHALPSGGARFR